MQLYFRELEDASSWAQPATAWLYRHVVGDADAEIARQSTDQPDEDDEAERAIICRRCRTRVTSARRALEVNGRQQHHLFNPAGVLFEIGCFDLAPGCLVHGEATFEFTWFPGFAWRYALCSGCQQHLGWRFESGDASSFFGLVLKHLAEEA